MQCNIPEDIILSVGVTEMLCLVVHNLLHVGIPELYSVLKLNLEELDVSSLLKAPGLLFRNLSIHSLSCCKDSLRNWSLSESSCSMKPLDPPRRTLTNIKIHNSKQLSLTAPHPCSRLIICQARGCACISELKSYGSKSPATGRAIHAGEVLGELLNK
jgi:hypothetical protein